MAENKVLEIEIPRFVKFFNPFIAFPYYCSIRRRSCGNHMRPHCVRTTSSWRPRRLCCHWVAAANPLRSHGAQSDRRGNAEPRRALCACTKCALWHGILGDPTASSGDATAIPRSSRRSHCAHLDVLSFSCALCSRREDATLVWQGLKISLLIWQLFDSYFLTWLLFGQWMCCKPIRSHVEILIWIFNRMELLVCLKLQRSRCGSDTTWTLTGDVSDRLVQYWYMCVGLMTQSFTYFCILVVLIAAVVDGGVGWGGGGDYCSWDQS